MTDSGETKNTLPSFERAKRESQATEEPISFEVEGDKFTLAPKLGTRALEAIGRASKSDPTAMFDFLDAQFRGDSYKRFLELDLSIEEELPAFVEFVMGFYGEPGNSGGSAKSSSGDGKN